MCGVVRSSKGLLGMLDIERRFQELAVKALRKHRYCGDCFPENGWPEVNNALAAYEALKRTDRDKHPLNILELFHE